MAPSIICISLALCAFVFGCVALGFAIASWTELRAMKNSTHKFVFGTPPPLDPTVPLTPVTPDEIKATSVNPYDNIT